MQQTQNLELSNIALKEQHYLNQKKASNFNFQLEPITHNPGQKQDPDPHPIQFKTKDINGRRQRLQKAQQLRKQLLLQKIAAKNYKYELRQKAQKQNKTITELNRELSLNKLKSSQNSHNTYGQANNNQRFLIDKVRRVYSKNQKVFSSTKGFHKSEDELIYKIVNSNNNNQMQPHQEFKILRLNKVKLPELNSVQYKIKKHPINNNENKQTICTPWDEKIKQSQQQQKDQPLSQILKTTDVRYFGIEQRQQDFQKMGKSLLKLIRRKYWCYDSLQKEEIYENFQNILSEQFM